MLRALTAFLMLIGLVIPATPAFAGAYSEQTTHVGSTWDAPDTTLRIWDRSAVSADVSIDQQLTPTDNPVCDLYTTTLTITWTALNGHLLTSSGSNYDDFSVTFRAVNATTWSLTPTAEVRDEQSPVLSQWYRKDTHKPDATVCPRDTRSVNHFEIWVDGPPRHHQPSSIVSPPSRNHLALVWNWFDRVDVIAPARVDLSTNVYRETEDIDGPCEVHVIELDLSFTAVGPNRIIAVGERAPGSPINYQLGDSTAFGRGVVAQLYYLDGTQGRSEVCPRDIISQDRIEIYTEATSRHR